MFYSGHENNHEETKRTKNILPQMILLFPLPLRLFMPTIPNFGSSKSSPTPQLYYFVDQGLSSSHATLALAKPTLSKYSSLNT